MEKFRGVFWDFFLQNPRKLKKFPKKGELGGLDPKNHSVISLQYALDYTYNTTQ